MITKVFFSGFGGQGVLMMGVSLAQSAMNKGLHVTYLPAYGAEMRGGTANCTVALGDEEIASPVASEPDYLVVMNSPSLTTFQNKVSSGGTIFINSSIIDAPYSPRCDHHLCTLRRYRAGPGQLPLGQYCHDGRVCEEIRRGHTRDLSQNAGNDYGQPQEKPGRG